MVQECSLRRIAMKITMAHGSGGKSSAQLMSDIFGKYFKNEILDRMEDAAVLDVSGKIACSTDSFVVTPLIFSGGDIGKLCPRMDSSSHRHSSREEISENFLSAAQSMIF